MKFFLALALITTTVLGYSQTKEKTSGEIKGSVTDGNGNLVPGATVVAVPQDISFESIAPRSTTADGAGGSTFAAASHWEHTSCMPRKSLAVIPTPLTISMQTRNSSRQRLN